LVIWRWSSSSNRDRSRKYFGGVGMSKKFHGKLPVVEFKEENSAIGKPYIAYNSIFDAINAGKYKNKMDWKKNHREKEEVKKKITKLGEWISDYYQMLERSNKYPTSLHPTAILEEIENLMVAVSTELKNYDEIKLQDKAYNAEDFRLQDLFKSDLEKEYGVENNPKKDLLYFIAWKGPFWRIFRYRKRI
jgi:hypothetical protein